MFIVLLLFALFIAFVTDYICFVPITVSVIFPIVYGVMQKSVPIAAILLISTIFILYRHIENLHRIKEGKELHFSFLWNRAKEAERFGVSDDDGVNYPFEKDEERRAL